MGCQPNIHNRGPRCTTGPPFHCECAPQSSLEGGSPMSHTLYGVWRSLKQRWAGKRNKHIAFYNMKGYEDWLITLKKVHGLTNQSLQFSVLHDSREADSLAWYPDGLLSFRGSTSVHRISPPCTWKVKMLSLYEQIRFLIQFVYMHNVDVIKSRGQTAVTTE